MKDRKKRITAINKIRENAESVEDLLQQIEEYLLECGVKLQLKQYPATFNLLCSNSQSAPKCYTQRFPNSPIPSGYPGWIGQWEGTVEIFDSSLFGSDLIKSKIFTSLKMTFRDMISYFGLHFFKTGSGNTGENFSIGGTIFVGDFPKMQKELDDQGGAFDVMSKEYFFQLNKYNEKFRDKRWDFITNNVVFKTLDQKLGELSSLVKTIEAVQAKMTTALKNDFNKQYGIPLPKPPTAFMKDSESIMIIHGDVSFSSETIHPELKGIYSHVSALTKEIKSYVSERPEEFI